MPPSFARRLARRGFGGTRRVPLEFNQTGSNILLPTGPTLANLNVTCVCPQGAPDLSILMVVSDYLQGSPTLRHLYDYPQSPDFKKPRPAEHLLSCYSRFPPFPSDFLYSNPHFQKIFQKVARNRATFAVFGSISESCFSAIFLRSA